jgi:hypothetical protein
MLSSLILLLSVLLARGMPGPDLNSATLQELEALEGLTPAQARTLHAWVNETGGLDDIYEVLLLPGFDAVTLDWLIRNTIVLPPAPRRISPKVMDMMERLSQEDGPGASEVEYWEDLLVRPMPLSGATHWDLRGLDGVTLMDAAAVDARMRSSGVPGNVRSLRDTDNLTFYAWRNMRDFVGTDSTGFRGLGGNYRFVFDGGSGRDGTEDNLEGMISELESALASLYDGSRDYSGSPVDSAALASQLLSGREALLAARDRPGFSHKIRFMTGESFQAGVRFARDYSSTQVEGPLFPILEGLETDGEFQTAKVFAEIRPGGPFHRVILGNYRLSLGQGLLIDNTDELRFRNTQRTWGLMPDLTTTRQHALTGGATEIRAGGAIIYGFGSWNSRDAVMNPDGTPNVLMQSRFRTDATSGKVDEAVVGGYGFYDLGEVFPVGTGLGAGLMRVAYGDSLAPTPETLDIPGDSYQWDCPEYGQMPSGDAMSFAGFYGQTVLERFSLQGELVLQDNGASAGLARADWRNDWHYLTCIYRRYEPGFTNPYNRGFTEQLRFDDTVFESPYRFNDPLYSQLVDLPVPKAEEGVYLETRYQISSRITFTKVYIDLWRTLPHDLENLRFQGEVEYRPVWPVRFRLKYKFQDKYKPRTAVSTNSRTTEYTFRTFILPAGGDYVSVSLRYGQVELTPNPMYGGDALMDGGFLSLQWEHDFNEDLSLLGGATLWTTSGMSQWEFEDTGIDFLDGRGTKFYLTFKNVLSDALQLRMRFLRKETSFPHNGFYRPDPDDSFHYGGDTEEVPGDFVDRLVEYGLRFQLDYRW